MTLFASSMDGKCFGKPEGGSAVSVNSAGKTTLFQEFFISALKLLMWANHDKHNI